MAISQRVTVLLRTSLLLVCAHSVAWAQIPTWTQLSATGGPTNGLQSVVYDSASNRAILFGGVVGTPCCTSFNDVWVLTNADGVGGTPVWNHLSPAAPNGSPLPRSFHSALYDSANNRMILFAGGQASPIGYFDPLFNDVWVLSNANGAGGTPTWIPLTPAGTPPVPREGHGAIYDAANNRMIVFGGGNNGIMDVPNDLWALTNANGLGGTSAWIQLNPSGPLPAPNERFAVGYDAASNRLMMFGGCCYWNNNTWLLTNANGLAGTPAWSQITPSGTQPPIREVHAYGYDPSLNDLIIFGYGSAAGTYNDTWLLLSANDATGAPAWDNVIPVNSAGSPPLPFTGGDFGAYDPAGARLMMMKAETDSQGNTSINPWVLEMGSLLFPVKKNYQCGNGTCTPASAPINSVFDHDMHKPYECGGSSGGWGSITAFTGEQGVNAVTSLAFGCKKTNNPLYGYTNPAVTQFLQGYNYTGQNVLYYDSHAGYDYNFGIDTPLYPAINGCVTYSQDAAGISAQRGHVLAIIPQPTQPAGGCQNVAKNAQYSIVYMHLSSFYDPNTNQVMRCTSTRPADCISGVNVMPCPTCAQPYEWVSTNRTNPIGYPGNFLGIWGGVPVHLHFEVDTITGNAPHPLDPYGWCTGAGSDPYNRFTGLVNTTLWSRSQFVLSCPIDKQ